MADYVYRRYGAHQTIHRHRILKRTPKQVRITRKRDEVHDGRKACLDRQHFDKHGWVWYHSLNSTFYASREMAEEDPYPYRDQDQWHREQWDERVRRWRERFKRRFMDVEAPGDLLQREALARLGLEPGASKQSVKRAFRKEACRTHPDRGGSAEAFIEVRAAYETAMAAAS